MMELWDAVYDHLVAKGVTPIVELSFMPNWLANATTTSPMQYHPNNNPPSDWAAWGELIEAVAAKAKAVLAWPVLVVVLLDMRQHLGVQLLAEGLEVRCPRVGVRILRVQQAQHEVEGPVVRVARRAHGNEKRGAPCPTMIDLRSSYVVFLKGRVVLAAQGPRPPDRLAGRLGLRLR